MKLTIFVVVAIDESKDLELAINRKTKTNQTKQGIDT